MKKILFVANTLQVGGAEKILLNVVRNIDKTKFEVTVLALVEYGILVDEIKKIEGVKYIGGFKGLFGKTKLNKNSILYNLENKIMNCKLKKYTKKIREDSDKLYNRFIKEKYDVEIAFLEGRVSKFLSKSTNNKSKKISWIHTDITDIGPENFTSEEDEIECYKKFDKIVCVSNGVRDIFTKKIGIADNVFVQMNPIDSNNILKLSEESIQLNKTKDDLVLCAVGRLEKVKGLDRLLRVHKRLLDEGIGHKIWIVGDGKQKLELQEYIKQNNLEDTVILVGYDKNPYKYMKNADIYICTSLVEGLSSTVIEAVILEKIILTTDCPGMKEILGENNALIVQNDEEGIYNGLKQLLTNKNMREEYSKNVKNISKYFDLQNTIKQIEDIIEG